MKSLWEKLFCSPSNHTFRNSIRLSLLVNSMLSAIISKQSFHPSQAPSDGMNVKDTRAAAYIQEKHVVPDYVDYSVSSSALIKIS